MNYENIKKIISSMLLSAVLAGCSSGGDPNIILSGASNCPISTLRTGTERQGIKTYGNGFECTDTGSYFMCTIGTETWLLYADYGSDTIIKLCGRPDCNHMNKDCNAYFGLAMGICYYNGFLYTYNDIDSEIIRMNLDGTERTPIYNISSFADANEYDGEFAPRILNGIFIIGLTKLDENGMTINDSYYYKLDGSMNEPKPIPIQFGFYIDADGESLVGPVRSDNGIYTYGIWDSDKGTVSELFKTEEIRTRGYIGTKAEYYIEDGIIIENSYTEGKKEMIDTGLKGNYQLVCFPDCMVAYKYLPNEEVNQETAFDEVTLYFYDWECNNLGSTKINYQFPNQLLGGGLICGETPERIILTDNYSFAPHYYINKSDLGTENIQIHTFNVPDFGTE